MKSKVKNGYYKHFKGNLYRVLYNAVDSETLEDLIVYASMYDSEEYPTGTIWVRPLKEFTGEVINIAGEAVYRFRYLHG